MPTASNPDAARKRGASRAGDGSNEAVFLKRRPAGGLTRVEPQGKRKTGGSRWPSPRTASERLDRFDAVLAALRRQLVARSLPNCTVSPGSAQGMADETWLLQAAFPECSSVDDRCGAGHATVAGAYVTIIKAFAEMHDLSRTARMSHETGHGYRGGALRLAKMIADAPYLFEQELALAMSAQDAATEHKSFSSATAPSVGREWIEWRCHFDHYEALRRGERMAVGILREELARSAAPLVMRFTSFDEDWVMLTAAGSNAGDGAVPNPEPAQVLVWPYNNRRPGWMRRSYASDKFKREAALETRKWWYRSEADLALPGR